MASAYQALEVSCAFQLPFMLERGAESGIYFPLVVLDAGQIDNDFTATIKFVGRDGSETQLHSVTQTTLTQVSTIWTPPTSLAFGEGYSATLTISDTSSGSVLRQFRNEAMIVRTNIACPISSANLYRVVTSLNPENPKPIHNFITLDGFVIEAWTRIQRRLIQQGNRPNLIMSPSALHDVAVLLSLALVFEDFSTRLNAAYMEQARMYREQYETAWARLSFVYADGDTTTANPNRRRGGSPALFLGTSRGTNY